MTDNNSQFELRKPRHEASESNSAYFLVKRSAGDTPKLINVGLADFSRGGVLLISNIELTPNENIELHIRSLKEDLELFLPAVVKWIKPDSNTTWQVGCEFEETADWETVGELFLSGVLSTAPSAGKPS